MKPFALLLFAATAVVAPAQVLFDDFNGGTFDSGVHSPDTFGNNPPYTSPVLSSGNPDFTRQASYTPVFPAFSIYQIAVDAGTGSFIVRDQGSNGRGDATLNFVSTAGTGLDLRANPLLEIQYRNVVSGFSSASATFSGPGGSANRQGLIAPDPTVGNATRTLTLDFTGAPVLENATRLDIVFGFIGPGSFEITRVQAVPEPATLAALGLGALALMRRRRR